jgi:anti-sigma B factor antagonist
MEVKIVKRNDRNGVIVALLKGVIDGESSQVFEKIIIDQIAAEEKKFIINLKDTDYVTSAGLRSFLVIGKLLKIRRGRIALTNFNESVRDVLKLMNFDSLFAMYDTDEEAFEEIGAAGYETLF